jgi:hypothetical protein
VYDGDGLGILDDSTLSVTWLSLLLLLYVLLLLKLLYLLQ